MKVPFLSVAVLCAALALPSHACAQSAYVSLQERLTAEQLRSVGLTPQQVERLDRMLRDAQERAAPAAVATPAVAAVGASAPQREDGVGRDRSSLVGFNDQPITSRLKGAVSGWEPGTVFELENGQQWKVLKGALKLPRTLEAPEIVVVPGVAGRWFLQVVEGMPKARVYRID